jgi:hypothetical protein
MTDPIRLTADEVAAITGTSRRARQFEWLLANGITAVPDVVGRPVVLRAAVEAMLMPGTRTRSARKTEPDLSALRKRNAA